MDGSECEWGTVLAWEPPQRVVLSWHLNGEFKRDESVDSAVEVRFIPVGEETTRVELEHRVTARDAEAVRTAVDSPNGWSALLALYAEAAGTRR